MAVSIQSLGGHCIDRYSFFIPDIDYLKDLPGLLAMLTEKIYERHQCTPFVTRLVVVTFFLSGLYCNKIYSGVGAVKSHMIDMKHTRIGSRGFPF